MLALTVHFPLTHSTRLPAAVPLAWRDLSRLSPSRMSYWGYQGKHNAPCL
jgi:hypothetical protein